MVPPDRRYRQRLARLALARQRVAVETGGNGRGDPGRVDQDRGGRATENRAIIDPGQQNQRRRGVADLDGYGDHDGDDRHGAQTRQHADEGADQTAGHHHHQVLQGKNRGQAKKNSVNHSRSSH
jgi:hypothetical protein